MRRQSSIINVFILAVIAGSMIFLFFTIPIAVIFTGKQNYESELKKQKMLLTAVSQAVGQNLQVYDYSEVRNQLKRMQSNETIYAVITSEDDLLLSNQEYIDKYRITADSIRSRFNLTKSGYYEVVSADNKKNVVMYDDIQNSLSEYRGNTKPAIIISITDRNKMSGLSLKLWAAPVFLIVGLTLLMAAILIIIVLKSVINPIKVITKNIIDKTAMVEAMAGNSACNVIIDLNEGKIKELLNLESSIQRLLVTYGRIKSESLQNEKYISLGQSTAMIAHDVRKPLASMKALLSVLPIIKTDARQIEKMIASVDHNIANTNAMLNDILEFSKDSTFLDLKDCDPQSIMVSALGDALRNHPGSKVKIEYDFKHTVSLRADGGRIMRVFVNIIDNALDAMTETDKEFSSGSLFFKTVDIEKDSKKMVRFTLSDNGHGIPLNIVDKVFDPFFTSGKKGGTGLGLAICQRIISLHGGSIEARNKENGRGAEFVIELPVGGLRAEVRTSELIFDSAELEPFRKEEKAQIDYGDTANTTEFMRLNKERGRKAFLLIMDDEPLFRETVRCLLSKIERVCDHVSVVEADSAEKAMELFRDRVFDYVIADIDLGKNRINGYEFSREILQKYSNTHIIIHSNKRREEMDRNIREIKSPRFMGFRPKPMTQSELLQFLACKTFEIKVGEKVKTDPKVKRVLILNDDEALLISFKYMLESPTVEVILAMSVDEAAKYLAGDKVDVILSDINFGKGEPSGYDFLKHVREKNTGLPFYFISSYSAQEEEWKAKAQGATGYFQLPMNAEKMKAILG